jgi:hypothetical protein
MPTPHVQGQDAAAVPFGRLRSRVIKINRVSPSARPSKHLGRQCR